MSNDAASCAALAASRAAAIERDARKMGSVSEDLLAAVAVHEDIAGVLLYTPDLSDAKFAVYLNRGKWGNYYRFSHGGSIYDVVPGQPFALALSTDRFSFYDAAGREIDPHQVPLFEQTDKDK